MHVKGGMLVALEGIDGCGKSTTISTLAKLCNAHHIANSYCKETTLTSYGKHVRHLLLDTNQLDNNKVQQAIDFAKARKQALEQIILPCLHHNELVICDRYMLSSMAYQANLQINIDSSGVKPFYDKTHVVDINHVILGQDFTIPQMYFYVSMPSQANVNRLSQRHRKLDKIDKSLTNIDNMKQLKKQYQFAIDETSAPVVKLDGEDTSQLRGAIAFKYIWNYIFQHHLKTYSWHN